jgi:hypothetical protein
MVSASINSVNFPVVDHEGCRKRKEEMKSQLGKPRLAGDGGCEVDSGLPSGVPASSLNGKSIKDPAIKEPSITFPFSHGGPLGVVRPPPRAKKEKKKGGENNGSLAAPPPSSSALSLNILQPPLLPLPTPIAQQYFLPSRTQKPKNKRIQIGSCKYMHKTTTIS